MLASGGGDPATVGQDRRRRRGCSTPWSSASRAPTGDSGAPRQALIFDSQYDQYRGVVSSLRVVNGRLTAKARLRFIQAGTVHDADEIGVRLPVPTPVPEARPRRGRLPHRRREGRGRSPRGRDRHPEADRHGPGRQVVEPLPGYSTPKPMVFCGLYPVDGDDFENLRESLERLRLNDASITYVPETSGAAGFGFRCGFLGLLHMDIVRERLKREFNLAVDRDRAERRVPGCDTTAGAVEVIDNPAGLPSPQRRRASRSRT